MRPLRSLRIAPVYLRWVMSVAILGLAALLGYKASPLWLVLIVGCMGAAVLIQFPRLGLLAVTPAALIVPIEISTGTAIILNPVTLLIPALLGLWALDMVRRRDLHFVLSRTNKPLFLFLLGGLLSFFIGIMIWDPAVPRTMDLTAMQLAQWGIFALSAGAYWLMGNMVQTEVWLRWMTFSFLIVAGGVAIPFVIPYVGFWVSRITTAAIFRAPFWMLLTAVAGGQLLFNQELGARWRGFLVAILGAVLFFIFRWNRDSASTWVAIGAVVGLLAWLRWSRMRWPVIVLVLILTVTGILSSVIYDFAGGDEEWEKTGGSRLELIGRVIEVTMRNPITGLGPAAYRAYAGMKPLRYGLALWFKPRIASHNNFVDLFSHVGLLGMSLFAWFAVEVTRLGLDLRADFTEGFMAGYVNGMLAAGAGALILMLFADWILPFVYNIGFPGFQASVLVWLYLGGGMVIEQIRDAERAVL